LILFGKKNKKKKPFFLILLQAIGITKEWNQDTVSKIVEIALDAVSSSWKPIVMIDHDEAERAGLVKLGLSFILCNFHVTKAIGNCLREIEVKSFKKLKKKKKSLFHIFPFKKIQDQKILK
jgi:hypothetical protein